MRPCTFPVPTRSSLLCGILSLILCASLRADPADDEKPLWVAIGHSQLHPGIKALAEHRENTDGFEVILSEPPIDEALQALPRRPHYILLLGDDSLTDSKQSPPSLLSGKRYSLYRWRVTQPETYVSDSAFGDLDDDKVPEIPVGRLPVTDVETLRNLSQKIIAFEKRRPSLESLHIPVWAGNPAYGGSFETNLASNLLRQTLHHEAPAWADLTLLMGNPSDPLAALPEQQTAIFNAILLRGGGLFTGLMGHGGAEAFYSMPHEGSWIRYELSDTAALHTAPAQPSSPAFIFACDCGNFAHPSGSLAEAFLTAPRGPVAVIAATTQSHPLPNYYSSICWLQEVRQSKATRLGDLWVGAQKRGYTMRNPLVEVFLKDVEGKLETKLNTPRIRSDHLLLYALLGDPATPLKRPLPLEAKFENRDGTWHWQIPQLPVGAQHLIVSHRPPLAFLQAKPDRLNAEETMALFRETNAKLQFSPLLEESPVQTLSGSVEESRGTLRLVVQTKNAFHVAAQVLDPGP